MREDHGLWNKVAKNLQERSLSWLMLLTLQRKVTSYTRPHSGHIDAPFS